MKKENPVVWFEIYTNNIDRAKKFYEAVLDTELTPMVAPSEGDLGEFIMLAFPSNMESTGKATGALVYMKGFEAGKNSTLVYFASDDCAIEESRVEGAGGKIFRPKMSIGQYGFISLAFDTEGNMFGIHSMK